MKRASRDHDLPGVRYVLDTRRGEDVRGVGHADGDALVTYHVTDRPADVVRFLRRRGALIKAYGEKGRTAELGPGFYASGHPEFWIPRARGKWSFLKGLDARSSARLTHALRQALLADRRRGRITASESARAVEDRTSRRSRGLRSRRAHGDRDAPLRHPVLEARVSFSLSISPGARPGVVELRVRGLFASLTGATQARPLSERCGAQDFRVRSRKPACRRIRSWWCGIRGRSSPLESTRAPSAMRVVGGVDEPRDTPLPRLTRSSLTLFPGAARPSTSAQAVSHPASGSSIT